MTLPRHSDRAYTTADELDFLRGLALAHPDRCRGYAALVLADRRRYDPGVDVVAVRDEASRLLVALSSAAAASA